MSIVQCIYTYGRKSKIMFKEIWEDFTDRVSLLKSKIVIILSAIFLIISAILYPIYWHNSSPQRISCTFVKCENAQDTSYVWGEPNIRYYTNFYFEMANDSAYDVSDWRGNLVVTNSSGQILSTTEINTFPINWIKSKDTLNFYVSLDESADGYDKIFNANSNDLTGAIDIASLKFNEKAVYLKEIILAIGLIYPLFLLIFFYLSISIFAYCRISGMGNLVFKVLLVIVFLIPYFSGYILMHTGPHRREFAVNSKGKIIGYYDKEEGVFVDKRGRPMFPDNSDK